MTCAARRGAHLIFLFGGLICGLSLSACQIADPERVGVGLTEEFVPAQRIVRTDEVRCAGHDYELSIAREHMLGVVRVEFRIDGLVREGELALARARISELYSATGVAITCTSRQVRFLVSGPPKQEYLEYLNSTDGALPPTSIISLILEGTELVEIN